jgi:hypothetical protein
LNVGEKRLSWIPFFGKVFELSEKYYFFGRKLLGNENINGD